jgi:hypothetical protein
MGAAAVSGKGDRTGWRAMLEMAKAAGMSRHQTIQALRIASIPEQEFEALIESENPQTVTALAERGTVRRPELRRPRRDRVDAALRLWAAMTEGERERFLAALEIDPW